MKKARLLVFVGPLVIAALLGGGYEWATVWRWHESTDDAYLHSDITPVSPKVGGHVAAVEVTDNQPVHKGDVLVRIDDRDFRAKVEELRAVVAEREAALLNLDARTEAQRAAINYAIAQLGSAGAELTRSQADLTRSRELVRDDFVSHQTLDTHQADALKANAGVRGAEANADASRRQLAVLESERQMDQAQLDQAKAQLAAAELDLEHTVITSPVEGVVGNRGVQLGEFVKPGTTLLAVVPLNQVWVEANFKETQIERMEKGQPVALTIDAYPGQPLTGRIDSVAPASGAKFSLLPPDNATGNFTKVVQRIPVKILVDADHPLAGKLRPGMSAVVVVDTKADHGAGLSFSPKAQAASTP
jgi:membrane fusion protein (multidrug efflux system)